MPGFRMPLVVYRWKGPQDDAFSREFSIGIPAWKYKDPQLKFTYRAAAENYTNRPRSKFSSKLYNYTRNRPRGARRMAPRKKKISKATRRAGGTERNGRQRMALTGKAMRCRSGGWLVNGFERQMRRAVGGAERGSMDFGDARSGGIG